LDLPMLELLDARQSVSSRASHGGTSPEQIASQLRRLGELLDAERSWLTGCAHP
jgi:argininosuccinate lyase